MLCYLLSALCDQAALGGSSQNANNANRFAVPPDTFYGRAGDSRLFRPVGALFTDRSSCLETTCSASLKISNATEPLGAWW